MTEDQLLAELESYCSAHMHLSEVKGTKGEFALHTRVKPETKPLGHVLFSISSQAKLDNINKKESK